MYFQDKRLQALLDAIRFIANPKEKTPAHITVRGPYSRYYDSTKWERKIVGTEAIASGVDSFFENEKNTIYIRCYSKKLREIWSKKDFGFVPHITLYDGISRSFAELLHARLKQIPLQFSFAIGELRSLVSHKGQQSTILRQIFDENIAKDVVGYPLKVDEVDKMSFEKRVRVIETFCKKLQGFHIPRREVSSTVELKLIHLDETSEIDLAEVKLN
ncbi:MAG: hypothetical protein OXH64_09270 [Rhodospirillaceae bacterium]|nr:hypothetical protein [Rhodospirillaceae bacterium]